MQVSGSKVGVVGGSIAGCAAAIALRRLGCEVTVLERSSGELKDRGSGIAIPVALRDELVDAGYLPADYRCVRLNARRWLVADGSPSGDLRWTQTGPMVTNNWSVLWRGLRDNLDASLRYRDGAEVLAIVDDGEGVSVELADGETLRFDVVFGADGYRSRVRGLVHAEATPAFAGYILWRGNFPAAELSSTEAWDEVLATREWLTVGFEGGHAVMYPIPDFAVAGEDGLRVNWAIYATPPEGLVVTEPSSIPPGKVEAEHHAALQRLIASAIPARLRPLFASPPEQVSIQPVYDQLVRRYAKGRLALIGDASTLSRPHTGSGATKATQDARTLEQLGQHHQTWPDLLAAYDADRTPKGKSLVELGRRIGRDQVVRTPPWHSMQAEDFERWTQGTLRGEKLYFWGDDAAS